MPTFFTEVVIDRGKREKPSLTIILFSGGSADNKPDGYGVPWYRYNWRCKGYHLDPTLVVVAKEGEGVKGITILPSPLKRKATHIAEGIL